MKHFYVALLSFFFSYSFAQNDMGEIHGNFESTTQFYNIDTVINAPIVDEKALSNTFANFNYVKGKFSAGVRFESYLNVLQGFDPNYKNSGFPYKYATYNSGDLEFTVGNYYEQFGNGLIFRSYEERALGIDNAMEGARVKYRPYDGVYLKGVIGKQRLFFGRGEGIVRGLDAEINLNEILDSLFQKTSVIIGGSFVSKYQKDNNPILTLPENVASFAGRLNISRGKVSLLGEYAYKMNDPNNDNSFIYKPGQALFVSSSFSQKGLGITLSAKAIDNMSFRSDRDESLNNLMINYLPALTRQHTYNLAATLYPYGTQPNGEVGIQADVIYKFKKGSLVGGKYGTSVALNYSQVNALDTEKYPNITDPDSTRMGYTTNFFSLGGDVKYFKDFNIEIAKKINKKIKVKASYIHLLYNMEVVQGLGGKPIVNSDIAVIDVLYKLNKKNAIRAEVQNLWTKQDQQNWGTLLLEYTFSPHWFVAFIDQYNYGNNDESKQIHYIYGSAGYNKGGNRIMLGYGRQRAGIFCVGGVCRNVPASNGLTLTITSTF